MENLNNANSPLMLIADLAAQSAPSATTNQEHGQVENLGTVLRDRHPENQVVKPAAPVVSVSEPTYEKPAMPVVPKPVGKKPPTPPKTITNYASQKWTFEATKVFVDTYLDVIKEHGLFDGGRLKLGCREMIMHVLNRDFPELELTINDFKNRYAYVRDALLYYERTGNAELDAIQECLPLFPNMRQILDAKELVGGTTTTKKKNSRPPPPRPPVKTVSIANATNKVTGVKKVPSPVSTRKSQRNAAVAQKRSFMESDESGQSDDERENEEVERRPQSDAGSRNLFDRMRENLQQYPRTTTVVVPPLPVARQTSVPPQSAQAAQQQAAPAAVSKQSVPRPSSTSAAQNNGFVVKQSGSSLPQPNSVPTLTPTQWQQCIQYLDQLKLDATRFVRAIEILETKGYLFILMDDQNRRKLLRGYGVDV